MPPLPCVLRSVLAAGWRVTPPRVRLARDAAPGLRPALALERADQRLHGVDAARVEVIEHARIDLAAHERVVEQRRSDADRAGAREHEFDRVGGGADPALTDDRNPLLPDGLVHLV